VDFLLGNVTQPWRLLCHTPRPPTSSEHSAQRVHLGHVLLILSRCPSCSSSSLSKPLCHLTHSAQHHRLNFIPYKPIG
jgi:hypothetical protein